MVSEPRSFDYLIIGGGAAGCIVARRLAEQLPRAKIALLESGKSDEFDPSTHFLSRLDEQDESYDWGYQAKPTQASNQKIAYSRAQVLGGCANHNDCAFIAPPGSDLNHWEALGATGWNQHTLAPALTRVEENIHIESNPEGNALSRAFIDANIELGLSERDFRKKVDTGTGWFPLNANGDLRQSSSVSYLHPIDQLPTNLTVFTEVTVQRLIIQNKQVVGVDTDQGQYDCTKETILCAGSINTPQIMMLSGLGPSEQIKKFDLPVHQHLPGVGQNLIDHVAANICYELKAASPAWAFTPCEATSLIKIDNASQSPDVLFHFVLRLREKYIDSDQFLNVEHGVKISPNVARPKSRGAVLLHSADPQIAPEIRLNYFSDVDGYDRRIMLGGLRFARLLAKTNSLSVFLKDEIVPGRDIETDQDMIEYMIQNCETVYHPCGTCVIGDPEQKNTVVAPDLKVKGMGGLRIADASVFPDMVTVNICNTVMMVAEHAVSLIVEDQT